MNLYLTASTKTKDLIIDFIEVKSTSGEIISLNWEESEVTLTETGFDAIYRGVCFGESDADGRLYELKNMEITAVQLYSKTDEKPTITIEKMEFEDFLPTTLTFLPDYTGGTHE